MAPSSSAGRRPKTMAWRRSLLLAAVACAPPSTAFHHAAHRPPCTVHRPTVAAQMTTAATDADVAAPPRSGGPSASGACYYRRADGPWRPRKELRSLKVGERLFATRLPDRDLLNGKSGPKVFLECGVGRKTDKGKWSIVNGMIRIGRPGMKKSVVRKKINRMPRGELIEVYVSRASPDEGRLEVCLSRDEALDKGSRGDRISASSLEVGDELMGVVKQVTPYGVFVDVNANRDGLLHISKVAQRRDTYIKKEEGLKAAGLGRGSPVKVVVLSNDRKRLEFDLASDVEESPADDISDDELDADADDSGTSYDMSADEAAAWAAYGANDEEGSSNDVMDDEAAMWAAYAADSNDVEGDDDYDEDADIEDALGIGSY